jgi:hypothetical protein
MERDMGIVLLGIMRCSKFSRQVGALAAVLLSVAALFEWGLSKAVARRTAAIEAQSEIGTRASLVGSYLVTGTDPDGMSYKANRIVDISLAASGALELDWDNGRQVGIGHVVGNVLAVAT